MKPYDSRCVTLDPGLTALALRGLQERDGHYPFIVGFTRRRRSRRQTPVASRREGLLPTPTPAPASRWLRAVHWFLARHRASAAA